MMSASLKNRAVICRKSGFTLVELMVVVAVLAALMSVGAPSFMEWIQNSRIRTAAESLQNGLQIARAEAVRRNTNVEFVLQGTSGAWTVRLQQGATFIQGSTSEGGGQVIVASIPEDRTTFTYNGLGRLSSSGNADGTEPLERLNVDLPASILSGDKTRDLSILIGPDGLIRMCDPDPNVNANDPRRC